MINPQFLQNWQGKKKKVNRVSKIRVCTVFYCRQLPCRIAFSLSNFVFSLSTFVFSQSKFCLFPAIFLSFPFYFCLFPAMFLLFPCRFLSFPCQSFIFLFPPIFLSFPCDFYLFPVTVESSVTATRSLSINSQAYEKSTAGKRLTTISERVPVTNLANGKRIVKYVRHVRHFLLLMYNLKGQRSTSVNHYRT